MILLLAIAVCCVAVPVARPRSAHAAPAQISSLVVTGAYGAALHYSPATSAPVIAVAPCGTLLPNLGVQGGWYLTQIGGTQAWVGGARVADAFNPPYYTCAGVTYQVGDAVGTYVASGCLSLRDQPSRDATILACVPNDFQYVVLSGPYDPGSGEDWLYVTSDATGSGWVLAAYLYPLD